MVMMLIVLSLKFSSDTNYTFNTNFQQICQSTCTLNKLNWAKTFMCACHRKSNQHQCCIEHWITLSLSMDCSALPNDWKRMSQLWSLQVWIELFLFWKLKIYIKHGYHSSIYIQLTFDRNLWYHVVSDIDMILWKYFTKSWNAWLI